MTPNRRRRTACVLPAVGLVLLLAACASGEDGSAPDCPAEAPSPAPQRPYAQDAELADRIPDEIDGRPIDIQTVCATVFDPGGLTTSDAMLDRVGVERRDVTIALSPPPNTGEASYVGINAWRYAGADEAAIRDAFLGLLEEAGIPAEEETIGGKTVHMAVFHAYYVAGDTLYAVLGEDEPMAAGIEALP